MKNDLGVQNEMMEAFNTLKRSIGYISREIDIRTLDNPNVSNLAEDFYYGLEELEERVNRLTKKIKGIEKKENMERDKKEKITRYIDNTIMGKLIQNFVRVKNSSCEVITEGDKLSINFIYTGSKDNKSIISTLEMLKLINWEIFVGKIKFNKFDTVLHTNYLATFSTSIENDIFKDWVKNQALNIIQSKYPDKYIEIEFRFDQH